ncbi:MAG: hypothetical protein V1495_00020 [Pseudomonadota bacterium]
MYNRAETRGRGPTKSFLAVAFAATAAFASGTRTTYVVDPSGSVRKIESMVVQQPDLTYTAKFRAFQYDPDQEEFVREDAEKRIVGCQCRPYVERIAGGRDSDDDRFFAPSSTRTVLGPIADPTLVRLPPVGEIREVPEPSLLDRASDFMRTPTGRRLENTITLIAMFANVYQVARTGMVIAEGNFGQVRALGFGRGVEKEYKIPNLMEPQRSAEVWALQRAEELGVNAPRFIRLTKRGFVMTKKGGIFSKSLAEIDPGTVPERTMFQIAAEIDKANAGGLFHTDLVHVENIRVRLLGRPIIYDWGLATTAATDADVFSYGLLCRAFWKGLPQ